MHRPSSWSSRNLPWTTAALRWVKTQIVRVARPAIEAVAHQGAQVTRLTMDWVMAPLTSADQELRGELKTLVARSRELARNDPHVARWLSLREENLVGPNGVVLQARVQKADGSQDRDTNRKIEAAWKEWGRPENASVDGRLSWLDIQRLAARTEAQDGEFLARMVGGLRQNPFGFSLQIMDPDQLDRDLNRPARGDQREIRMGVEVNGFGRPVAYHFHKSHPHDYQLGRGQRDHVRVPARDVIHWYDMKRPGQTRGVPRATPILLDIHMRRGLQQAEVIASRIEATKGGFFEQDPDAGVVQDPNKPAGTRKRIQMRLEPGLFDTLPVGLKFKPWDPQHPNNTFSEFNTTLLQSNATGLRTSYHALTGDLTKVSFSSIRDGTIRDRDVYRMDQQSLITHLHERVYERWLLWALTTGALELGTRDPSDWNAHEWQPRGWEWVDPLKDILTLEKEIELWINSRTRGAAERGRDLEQILMDLERENEEGESRGLTAEDTGARALSLRRLAEMDEDDYERLTPDGLVALIRGARHGNGASHAHR